MNNYESLIGVIPGTPLKQEGVGDDRACRLFKALWNVKYPTYHVRVIWNDHDFGAYPEVGLSESAFYKGIDDTETFSGEGNRSGIEFAAGQLVDEWNARLDRDDIGHIEWAEIVREAGWVYDTYPVPFKMEY